MYTIVPVETKQGILYRIHDDETNALATDPSGEPLDRGGYRSADVAQQAVDRLNRGEKATPEEGTGPAPGAPPAPPNVPGRGRPPTGPPRGPSGRPPPAPPRGRPVPKRPPPGRPARTGTARAPQRPPVAP